MSNNKIKTLFKKTTYSAIEVEKNSFPEICNFLTEENNMPVVIKMEIGIEVMYCSGGSKINVNFFPWGTWLVKEIVGKDKEKIMAYSKEDLENIFEFLKGKRNDEDME